jgi:hypothetical protein
MAVSSMRNEDSAACSASSEPVRGLVLGVGRLAEAEGVSGSTTDRERLGARGESRTGFEGKTGGVDIVGR